MKRLTSADNYHSWKFNMQMVLIGLDLWEIVEGTEVVRDEAPPADRLKHKRRSNLARSKICLAIDESLQIYVRSCLTAKEAWEALENHFEEKTLSKKILYRRKLYDMRLGSETMEVHINEMKTVAERLEGLGDPVSDKDLVMILISSLTENYNNLVTTLETLNEEQLTWTYVRDRLMTEFERRNGDRRNPSSEALFVGSGKRGGDKSKGPPECWYCHEKGHLERNCDKKKEDAEKKKIAERSTKDSCRKGC